MKNKIYIATAIAVLMIIFNSTLNAQDLSGKKIIEIKYGAFSTAVLEKTVWIRLKPNADINHFLEKGSDYKITPLLPAKAYQFDKVQRPQLHSIGDNIGNKISRMYVLEYNENIAVDKFIEKLQSKYPEIEAAEPYYVYELQSPQEPNDPLYSDQFSLETIKAKEAFKNGLIGDTNTVIAISDAGTQTKFEDLKDNIAYNYNEIPNNGIDDDNNGYIDDYAGYNFAYKEDNTQYRDIVDDTKETHGTVVASIASAKTDNGLGIAGAGNQCRYFPLKSGVGRNMFYGYQSIVYAAVRGFKVINCSWGRVNKPSSQFEQDVINYAVSRNVAVVAASGTIDGAILQQDVFYPANYFGVLGVGATETSGYVSPNVSTLGVQTKILAPGNNKSTNGYGYSFCGSSTSFATPVVSGFVGLIRSKYPNLNAVEALEFARFCVDDVREKNQGNEFFLPGLVNFMKAVELNPDNIISLKPIKIYYTDNNSKEMERLDEINKEINIKINAHSYFAEADNITFKLSFYGEQTNMKIIRNEVKIPHISGKSDFEISGFKVKLTGEQPEFTAFRVDIYKDDKLLDFFTFRTVFNSDIATFSNKSLTFSVSDYGKFGFSIYKKNETSKGFSPGNNPSLIAAPSGLSVTIDEKFVYTGLKEGGIADMDFTPLKKMIGDDRNISILGLAHDDYYNLSLISKYTFIDDTLPIVRIDFELLNTGDKIIKNPAMGLFFDWDLPANIYENTSEYFPKGMPAGADILKTAPQIISNNDRTKNIGTLVFTRDNGALAQSAAMEYNKNLDIITQQIPIFNSGTSIQTNVLGDIQSAAGMRFKQDLKKNDRCKFTMIIAYAESEEQLADRLHYAYGKASKVEEFKSIDCEIYPNPASNHLFINTKYELNNDIEIYNIRGEAVMKVNEMRIQNMPYKIDIEGLHAGTYIMLCGNKILGSFVKE